MLYGSYKVLNMTPAEAILKFCAVINPLNNIYHANFFVEEMRKMVQAQKQYFQPSGRGGLWFERKIVPKLISAYSKAEILHCNTNPGCPWPKKITYRLVALGWVLEYQKGFSVVGLLIPNGKTRNPSILIRGRSEALTTISKLAKDSDLPAPTVWTPPFAYDPLQQPEIAPQVQNPLSDIRNIRVPLGDLLDFLDKYR